MNSESQGAPASDRRLSDVLAAEALAFGGGLEQSGPRPESTQPAVAPVPVFSEVLEPPRRRSEKRQAPGARSALVPQPEEQAQRPAFDGAQDIPGTGVFAQTNRHGASRQPRTGRSGFWNGAWPRRAMVCAILVIQALLSLRNNNTAFVDEALYLYSGHLELGQLVHGTPTGDNFWAFFSGAPVLYPVLGAAADGIGGLFAARLLSLAFMLGATCMLYLITRRMLGTRAAICAAALFCCTEPVIFVGNLATYDAPALFLLSLATWIVVRFAHTTWPVYLLAILPASLAVATKYAALMFVPAVLVLAFLTAFPRFGWRALIRPAALAAGIAAVLYVALRLAGENAMRGLEVTTTSRAQGRNTVSQVLDHSAQWGGALFIISLVGAAFLIAMPRAHGLAYLPADRRLRVSVAALLCGTALMAPLYQAHLHTTVSLQKHIGFGLFFAAPLAGYALARLTAKHVPGLLSGVVVLATICVLGASQSLTLFHVWPNSSAMVQDIARYEKPNGRYLVGSDAVAIYGLLNDPDCQQHQFTDTWSFSYRNSKGKVLKGTPAFTAAIQAGYFQVIVYTGAENPPLEKIIEAELSQTTKYTLVDTIPERTSSGVTHYYVWARQTAQS